MILRWLSTDVHRLHINTEVHRTNNTRWKPGWLYAGACVCHQNCEIIGSRHVWNCSAAVLRIKDSVIIRLLSPVTVEIIPQSLQKRILVVSIQTTVIQHCKMVTLRKTLSCSHRQRWLSFSGCSLLRSRSGKSCKMSFFLPFWKAHLCLLW